MARGPGAGGRMTRAPLRGGHARAQRGAQPPAPGRGAGRADAAPRREWVVVDDGSTDATPRVLAELAARHAWVRPLPRGAPANGQLAAGPPRGPRPDRVPRRASEALSAPVDVVDQGGRRHRLRPRLLRAPDGPLRRRRAARHRERHLLRARGRQLGAPLEGGHHGVGRHPRLPRGLPRRT